MVHLYRHRINRSDAHDDDATVHAAHDDTTTHDDDASAHTHDHIIHAAPIKYRSIQNWEKGLLLRLPLFKIHTSYLHWDITIAINWYIMPLVLIGFIGGILTSITGSGSDLLVFATSYFIFHIDRSTSIATSVVVMSITSIIAYYYNQSKNNYIFDEVYSIWLISIPCVAIGLPVSTIATIKFLHALSNRICVNIYNIIQFVIIMYVMCSTLQQSSTLLISTTVMFIIAMVFFISIMMIGRRDDIYMNQHTLVTTTFDGDTIDRLLVKPTGMDDGMDGEDNKDSDENDTQITESDDTIGRDRKIADVCCDDDGNWVMTLPNSSVSNSPLVEYGRIYQNMLPSPLMKVLNGSPNIEYADVYQSHCYYHHDNKRTEGNMSPKFEYDHSDSMMIV